jgi:hypothetical protein
MSLSPFTLAKYRSTQETYSIVPNNTFLYFGEVH